MQFNSSSSSLCLQTQLFSCCLFLHGYVYIANVYRQREVSNWHLKSNRIVSINHTIACSSPFIGAKQSLFSWFQTSTVFLGEYRICELIELVELIALQLSFVNNLFVSLLFNRTRKLVWLCDALLWQWEEVSAKSPVLIIIHFLLCRALSNISDLLRLW